jgi:ABC-type microcin C transport system permease subunit YejE
MRTLEQLIDRDEPAMPLIRQWLAQSSQQFDVLEPSATRNDVLFGLQVTTRSPMGAIAYETGGVLIANGWLRVLASGHPRLNRNIVESNTGRSNGQGH